MGVRCSPPHRRVTPLGVAFKALELGCFVLAVVASNDAFAAPSGVKLSFASADASTTIAISWVTQAELPTVVEYGVASTAENMSTGNPPVEIAGIGWFHEIELVNLQPNTRYKYRVGSSGDFSPEYTFKTAPNDGCTPFTFVQLGDARSQNSRGPSPNWSSIHQEAMATGAEFILNGGDLVKEGNEIAQWATWLSDSEMVNPFVPMMPAIGNHDDGPGDGNSANYNRLFALPTNTVTGTEDYYYFVYNNALIFSLSTQTFDDWQAQMDWLTAIAAQHPEKWKLAYFHHPVYTTQTTLILDVGHPPNEKGQNPYYGPTFDAVGMDIVFQSHNHIYERFQPMRYDPNDPEQGLVVQNFGNGPNDGRLYVVSGGSGSFLDPLIEGQFTNFANGSESRSKDHHFLKIAIAGNTLHYTAIRTVAGNSSGGGTVIDEVVLTRPGIDPCTSSGDPDDDGDGFPASRDCDDGNADVNPGRGEICGDTIDQDCSGVADLCPAPPADADGDGSPAGTDCDDNNAERYPEKTETECDGIDNDCDCIERCSGGAFDLCNAAPDAGTVLTADAAAREDAELTPDATASEDARAQEPAQADAGAARPSTLADESCGCTASREGEVSWAGLSLIAAVTLRRRRRS
jgi:MYXO-CTERM domain-containing protein